MRLCTTSVVTSSIPSLALSIIVAYILKLCYLSCRFSLSGSLWKCCSWAAGRVAELGSLSSGAKMAIRAHRKIKNQNRDWHTWIFIGNWILNLICFLQFLDLSTPSAAKMQFYFLHFLQGENAQNRPKSQQNGNFAKTIFGPKTVTFTKSAHLWDHKMDLQLANSKFYGHFYSSNIPQILSYRLLFH